MLFLIDGYNLLHAIGLVAKQTGPDGLEWARRRLLSFLRDAFPDDATSVTVVFDAANSPRGVVAEHEHEGIHVMFAVHRLVTVNYLLQAGEILNRVFIAPASLRYKPLRFAPHSPARKRCSPFADRPGPHHVIAKELKLIPEALL